MARSRRRHPIAGYCVADSEKRDKQAAHRVQRAAERRAMARESDIMPLVRETSNVWAMAKDGKGRFDVKRWPEGMRK